MTGTVSVNKKLLTGTVPVNNLFLKGTPKKSSTSGELGSPNSPKSYFKTPCNISEPKDNPFLVKSMWNRKKNNPKFKLTLMGARVWARSAPMDMSGIYTCGEKFLLVSMGG